MKKVFTNKKYCGKLITHLSQEVKGMRKNTLVQGSVFQALLLFSIPMIVTNTVNLLFHAADVAVLSLFADGPAVAAVGVCGR